MLRGCDMSGEYVRSTVPGHGVALVPAELGCPCRLPGFDRLGRRMPPAGCWPGTTRKPGRPCQQRLEVGYARSQPPPISRHSADREPQSVVTAKRRNLTCGFKAIGPVAAIGVGTISVRRAVTRSAILGQLNTVDKLGLLHLAGSYAKVSGFGLNLRHVHALFYYLRCRHLFTPKFYVSQYSSVPYMCILLASIKSE